MSNIRADATGPSNINDLYTTTLNNISKGIQDNIFEDYPVLAWLKMNGRVKLVSGGEFIQERLEYKKNATAAYFDDYEALDTNPNQTLTSAFFQPRQAAVSITISAKDEAMNQGKERISGLLEHRTQNANSSLQDLMSAALFNATPASNEPHSLAEIIDSADPSRGNVGQIDRDTYTWWQAQEVAMGSFSAGGISAMNDMKRLVSSSHGKNVPELIVGDSTSYGYFENALEPQKQYTDAKMGEAGFQNLRHGTATVIYDKDCNSGTFYYLNSKYISLALYNGFNFKTLPFVKPSNQAARTAQIVSIYNLCTSNPRRLGKNTGITA